MSPRRYSGQACCNFSMVLREPEARALERICARDRITRSDAMRLALAAYAAGKQRQVS